jgi:hypothetical protein
MSVSIHQSTLPNISDNLTRISTADKTSSLKFVEQISLLGLVSKLKIEDHEMTEKTVSLSLSLIMHNASNMYKGVKE